MKTVKKTKESEVVHVDLSNSTPVTPPIGIKKEKLDFLELVILDVPEDIFDQF